jgi:rSAM/selenodomain-associated transferase 2
LSRTPEISVIIPAANEAAALPSCLARIAGAPNEILVVDAQSEDDTAELARAAGCLVLKSAERNRARQLNLGASKARGRIFLFLHADTFLPLGGLKKIIDAIDRRGAVGGAFSRRYRSPSWTLALTSRLAALRNRAIGWHLGDQGIFVRRDIFEKMNGYRDIPIFEDLDFSRRLRTCGRTVTLTPPVYSSARRFEAMGPMRRTWADIALTRRYLSGADPNELCIARGHRVKPDQLNKL